MQKIFDFTYSFMRLKVDKQSSFQLLWKCGNKEDSMKHAHEMVRFSLDIPTEQHIHLKMMATKRGISMREYILEALAFKEADEEKDLEMDNTAFRKGLKRIRNERYQLAKNLSKR